MKEHTRNVAVGLTVVVALGMLGGMILIFAGLPEMFQRGRLIRMHFPATGDVHEGDPIHLAGMRVGKITDISFVEGDPRKGVQFTARIDADVPLPGNVQPRIFTRGFVGAAYVDLGADGPERLDPATGRRLEFLPDRWDRPLEGIIKGSGLIPEEFTQALRGLSRLADSLNDLLAAPASAPAGTQPVASAPASGPGAGNLREALVKLGKVLDAMDIILGDPQNQANLKTSLANLSRATASATEAMDALKEMAEGARTTAVAAHRTFDEGGKALIQTGQKIGNLADNADRQLADLSRKLMEDAEKLSAVLTGLNQVIAKMDSGQGTAGQLLNDPKLYNSLLDAANQLSQLTKEFRQYLEQWSKQGIPLKFK